MNLTPFHGPPASPPAVPGFAARTLLGFGAHGEVWLAEDLSTGADVALKVGRRPDPEPVVPAGVPPSPGGETALLCRIDHPHIVRLRRVVPFGESGLAMVLDHAAGGSLAALVAARGPFDPGEVTTVLIPLAGALGHLHRRGVVHGDLAPGNVLFTGEGRPQLGDLGVARVLGARKAQHWATPGFTDPALAPGGGPADARAADLWGLAAVGWFALTGYPPHLDADTIQSTRGRAPALVDLLVHCLDADPAARPGLDELADRAWQAARPIPVRLVTEREPIATEAGLPPLTSRVTRPVPSPVAAGSAADPAAADRNRLRPAGFGPRPSGPTAGVGLGASGSGRAGAGRFRGTGPRVRLLMTVAAIAVATACAAGVAVRSHGISAAGVVPARSSSSPEAVSSQAGPTAGSKLDAELGQALTAIGRSRAAAFASASTDGLARADQKGSPAYRADAGLVERLRARGYRLLGVRYELRGVHVLRRLSDSVDVAATVTTSLHRQVRTATKTSVAVPADGPRSVVFTVVPLGPSDAGSARWRIYSVQAPS